MRRSSAARPLSTSTRSARCARGRSPWPSRSRTAGVAVTDEDVSQRSVDRVADGTAAAASLAHQPSSASSSRSRSPSLVHQPHETRTRPVRGISRTWTPAPSRRSTSARGLLPAGPEGDERRAVVGHDHLEPPGEELAAALGDSGGVLEGPGRPELERREQPRERRRRPPVRLEPDGTGTRLEAAVGLVRRPGRSTRARRPAAGPAPRRRAPPSRPARRATSARRS